MHIGLPRRAAAVRSGDPILTARGRGSDAPAEPRGHLRPPGSGCVDDPLRADRALIGLDSRDPVTGPDEPRRSDSATDTHAQAARGSRICHTESRTVDVAIGCKKNDAPRGIEVEPWAQLASVGRAQVLVLQTGGADALFHGAKLAFARLGENGTDAADLSKVERLGQHVL